MEYRKLGSSDLTVSRVVIATKVGILRTEDDFIRNLKPASVRKEIDDSLARLGVDAIDLWQIHWPDEKTPLEDTLVGARNAAQAVQNAQAGGFALGREHLEQIARAWKEAGLER